MSFYNESNFLTNNISKHQLFKNKFKSKSQNNILFSKKKSKFNYSMNKEKEIIIRKVNKSQTTNYNSSFHFFPHSTKIKQFLNPISIEDRKNLKKINNNDINDKTLDLSTNRTNKKKSNLQNFFDNYIEKLNKKIDEYEKNKKDDLFNYKPSKGKIKSKFLATYVLKNGNKIKTYKSSTFLFKKSQPQENILRRLLTIKQNNSSLIKSIKLQNIKWLWIHKSFIIEKLILNFPRYRWFIDKNKFITKNILEEFMRLTNMKKDETFIDNVFLIFDYEKNNLVDFKKVLFSFIITSNNNYKQKIRLILNLIISEDNVINLKDFNNLFIYTISYNERKCIIDLIKKNLNINEKNKSIDDSLLFKFLIKNDKIYICFKKYFINYDDIINDVDNEINNAYMGKMNNSKNSLFGNNTKSIVLNDLNKLIKIINTVKRNKGLKEKNNKSISIDK
jgi:hypothetical protein